MRVGAFPTAAFAITAADVPVIRHARIAAGVVRRTRGDDGVHHRVGQDRRGPAVAGGRLTVADLVRSRLITLTRHGRTKLAETDVLREKAQKGFEAAFGRTDSESLREALRFLTSDGFSAAFDKALSRSR